MSDVDDAIKIVGRRKQPKTPQEFHALGAQLDREAEAIAPSQRERGFVFKARSWDELEQWQMSRFKARHRRITMSQQALLVT